MLRRLVLMGIIAGAPTIAGAWIGGFLYSPVATIIFLSIGAGAIFQVVYSIGSWVLRPVDSNDNYKNKKIVSVNIFTIAGFAVGMLIMYAWRNRAVIAHTDHGGEYFIAVSHISQIR